MIKTISLDLETYSSVDISKSGVYRYAESDDFEILLLSYSLNGGEIHTIDLAMGEEIPEDVLKALVSEDVEHWAYNSSFERICLSSWLRKNRPDLYKGYGREDESTSLYLSPSSWYCDMVLSAYSGLPLSLKGVGAVLKLDEQKDEKGKPLIKFFCTPTQSGERHYYYHDIIRWEEFKKYNAQDVRTEMAIHKRLNEKYPVPRSVWDEYHMSETINDRGIAVDMDLVRSAIALDKVSRENLTQKLSSLTLLENPNSVSQMKGWLKENGIEAETLGKKAVEALLKNEDISPEIKETLCLRLQLAKSSIRKYDAIENCVCRDGRVHGMFMFYGANRTGRWCLTGDHEILTKHGWVRLDEWEGGSIACWNARNEIVSFQKANALSFDYTGPMYTYKDCRIDQCSTPDHRMRAKRRCDKPWEDMTVEEMAKSQPMIPMTGYKDYRCCADPAWLRVLIMTQADGFYTEDGTVRYHFKKLRKVERCKMLLRKAGIFFTENYFKNGCTSISIPARCVPLWLRQFTDKTFGYWLFDENPDIFFDELPYWDGYYPAPNSIQYSTINKTNADLVQALAHMSGRTAVIRKKKVSEKHPNWNDAYVVDIWQNVTNAHTIATKPEITDYSGKVYCAETSTGYFLVRRNGKVWVTGNSGRIVQLQNLRQNHIEDLENARELVKTADSGLVEALYDDVPDTLSQLIRTAFIPRDGYKFIVADYSAIEARVIAYLAKEQWRIDAFARGDDIYCAAASQMFKVPVVKHGINGDLRAKGKVAELACIAEGQLVLTDRGLVPIEKLTLRDKVWDGEDWVNHDGVIYRGKREVITYEGLTATADHLVWVEGKSEPIQFGLAATSGAHLVQTGDGRRAIRLGENHKPREEVEREMESLLCADAVSGMSVNPVADPRQPYKRQIKRVPELYTAEANTSLAGQETNGGKEKMREPKRSSISKLWGKRDKIRLSKCNRSRTVSNPEVWDSQQGDGTGQNRHEWKLCSRKCPILFKNGELQKQKGFNFDTLRAKVLALLRKCSGKETVIWDDERRYNRGCTEGCSRETEALAYNRRTARLYDIQNAGRHHRFTVSGKLVHNCGYGGGPGALKAMGALDMGLKEEDLKPLVDSWRAASPNIVQFWWDTDEAVKTAIREHTQVESHGLLFEYKSGMLFITLPSGRHLSYVKPHIELNQYGTESVTYEGIGNAKKWERIESYGPKFVENCIAEGTLIITDRGLIPIENITTEMLIWDGEEFVKHDGLIYQGKRDIISLNGIEMTPDHKILTNKGWKKSAESNGFNWAPVSLPNGFKESRKHSTWKHTMAVPVHMQKRDNSNKEALNRQETLSKIVRVHDSQANKRFKENSRNLTSPGMGCVAQHEAEVPRHESSCLEKLRRTWHKGLRQVAGKFRELLGRYGANMDEGTRFRPHRQQRELLPRELQVDNKARELSQQKEYNLYNDSILEALDGKSGRTQWHKKNNSVLSDGAPLVCRVSIPSSGLQKQVYDIRNCGPRHRFAVWNGERALIVSNCVQAISRDILCSAMLRLQKAGISTVAHVHDETINEVPMDVSVEKITAIMSISPEWMKDIKLTAAGYECSFYMKD